MADFVTDILTSQVGNDMVVVIVDKLSKRAIFVPCKKTDSAKDIAHLFQDHLYSKHGTPHTLVTDRDPKFTSNFWTSLAELTNLRFNMSSTAQLQTDRQSENMIRTLSTRFTQL